MARTKVQSELIATNAISGTIIADNAITSTHIAQNNVTATQIATNNVTTEAIAQNNVTSVSIAQNSILTQHIQNDQITGDQLTNNITIAGTLTTGGLLTVNDGAIFNEESEDKDFRVESNDLTHMFFVDAGNNKIGMGTSSPPAPLSLFGSGSSSPQASNLQQAYDNAIFRINTFSNSSVGLSIGSAGSNVTSIQTCYNDGTSAPLAINPFGDSVGIGTNSPTHQLHLKGPSNAYAAMRLESASASHGAIINLSDSTDDDYGQIVQFASSAGEGGRMRFIAGGTETINLRGGRLGVGASASSPNNTLDVHAAGSSDIATFRNNNGQIVIGKTANLGSIDMASDAALRVRHGSTQSLLLAADGKLTSPQIKNSGSTITTNFHTAQKGFQVSFANGVANQKVKLILSATWWGDLTVRLTGTYSNQNMAGVLEKRYGTGLNAAANQAYSNESRVTESLGATADNFHLGDVEWDSGLGKWIIVITHRVSTGNQLAINVEGFCQAASDVTDLEGFTVSSVYTTDTTTYGQQHRVPSFNAILSGGQTITTTNTNIAFNSELFDNTGSHSNGVFTAPVAGIYSFGANFLLYPFTTGIVNVRYIKNSSAMTTVQHGASANSHTGITLTQLVSLAKNDTLSLQVSGSSLTSTAVYGGQSYWHGHLIG